MSLQIAGFAASRGARTADPKRHAQEESAKGNWQPTKAILEKADPDFVRRWFMTEAKKRDMRVLYSLANQQRRSRGKDDPYSDLALQRAVEFWEEYGELDQRWLGDLPGIKQIIAREVA